jgi:hypothetical protein
MCVVVFTADQRCGHVLGCEVPCSIVPAICAGFGGVGGVCDVVTELLPVLSDGPHAHTSRFVAARVGIMFPFGPVST